jgi:hypothetical protein
MPGHSWKAPLILVRHHHCDNGLALVAGAALRLEPHERGHALPVVHADVDAEAHL